MWHETVVGYLQALEIFNTPAILRSGCVVSYIFLSLMFIDMDLIALVGILKSSIMGINFLLSLFMIPSYAINTNLSDI